MDVRVDQWWCIAIAPLETLPCVLQLPCVTHSAISGSCQDRDARASPSPSTYIFPVQHRRLLATKACHSDPRPRIAEDLQQPPTFVTESPDHLPSPPSEQQQTPSNCDYSVRSSGILVSSWRLRESGPRFGFYGASGATMNSLSIISSTVDKVLGNTPPVTPGDDDSFRGLRRPYRRNQYHGGATKELEPENLSGTHSGDRRVQNDASATSAVTDGEDSEDEAHTSRATDKRVQLSIGRQAYMVFVNPWLGALRWIISVVAASAEWILSSLYNEDGKFSPRIYLRRPLWFRRRAVQPAPSSQFSTRVNTGADEEEELRHTSMAAEHRRSRSFGGDLSHASEDISPRRSIRIRLYNEERMHQGKSSSIKSPTSSQTNHRITRYPRTAGPPVPLLSRNPAPKTLILDLDETLIHSLAKGGRLSSGHMVEVKLDKQHAILYYVHKRPYCDEFLRRVCKCPFRDHLEQ